VPVLVHSNQNAPIFLKQQLLPTKPNLKIDQYQHNHNLINKKLNLETQQMIPMRSNVHLKPQQHMNLPQQFFNIQVMEP